MTHRHRPILLATFLGLLLVSATVAAAPRASAEASVSRDGSTVTLANGMVSVSYDLALGLADYAWGDRILVSNGYASAALAGDLNLTVYSFDPAERSAEERTFRDAAGSGVALEVTTALEALDVALVQQIFVYHDLPYLTQRVSVGRTGGDEPVAVAQIEVIAASPASEPRGGASIEPAGDARFYQVPFYNNDDFAVIPTAEARGALSYWLGGLVDADGGAGLVAGAVETKRWKSAVWYDGPSGSFSAHSGTQSGADTMAAAPRRGAWVESALTFLGYRAFYQWVFADLMNVVAAFEPPLPAPPLPAPIGWSAWYQHGLRTDEGVVRGVSEFIAERWAELGYRYINLDAGWNSADGDTRYDPARFPSGIEAVIGAIHDRGLLAGGYFVPFAISPSIVDNPVPGTPYRVRDLLVRDGQGRPIQASILTWEYVLDTTHPGAEPFLYWSARRLADYGFDFIKVDFLQIGTQEGVRYDPEASAMEAFHRGMALIRRAWRDNGRPLFISAAISPLYVQEYVHARRVGNDVEFGQARQAANVGLSWFTGLLYHRNDPDNAVVRGGWYPGYSDGLAKLHATMSALGGTLFLAGDDPRELSPARAALMTNPNILDLAEQPLVIRPLSVKQTPAGVWHAAEADGSHLVAVFNWDGGRELRRTIRFRDLGLAGEGVYELYELWEDRSLGTAESSFEVELPAHGVTLLRLTRQ